MSESNSEKPEKPLTFNEKMKQFLKKTGKKLGKWGLLALPLIGSWAVGMFFPPAVPFVSSFIAEKVAKHKLKVNQEQLSVDLTAFLKKGTMDGLQSIVFHYLKKSNEKVNNEKLELIIESILQPVINGFKEAIEYAKKEPRDSINLIKELIQSNLMDISEENKHESQKLIQEINKYDINRFVDNLNQIQISLKKLEKKLDDAFYSIAQNISKELNVENITFLARCLLEMTSFSSRFEIEYDPDIYQSRSEPERVLNEFCNQIPGAGNKLFLLLSEMGMGKTWLLTHHANLLFEQESKILPLFLLARDDVFKTIGSLFGSKLTTETFNLLKDISIILGEKEIYLLIIVDGLDELEDKEKMNEVLNNLIRRLLKENIPVILSCRLMDWRMIEEVKNPIKGELINYIFTSDNRRNENEKASLILSEFSVDEITNALIKYRLEEQTLSDSLKKLCRKPFFLRIISDWFMEFSQIPMIDNPQKFALLLQGDKEFISFQYQNLTYFGRANITDTDQTVLYNILDIFINQNYQINYQITLNDLMVVIEHNRISWEKLLSAGIFQYGKIQYGVIPVIINELLLSGLLELVKQRRNFLNSLKKSTQIIGNVIQQQTSNSSLINLPISVKNSQMPQAYNIIEENRKSIENEGIERGIISDFIDGKLYSIKKPPDNEILDEFKTQNIIKTQTDQIIIWKKNQKDQKIKKQTTEGIVLVWRYSNIGHIDDEKKTWIYKRSDELCLIKNNTNEIIDIDVKFDPRKITPNFDVYFFRKKFQLKFGLGGPTNPLSIASKYSLRCFGELNCTIIDKVQFMRELVEFKTDEIFSWFDMRAILNRKLHEFIQNLIYDMEEQKILPESILETLKNSATIKSFNNLMNKYGFLQVYDLLWDMLGLSVEVQKIQFSSAEYEKQKPELIESITTENIPIQFQKRIKPPFPAFKGESSFIFISYAHLDSIEVYKIINKLNDQGFPIWYDEGIPIGEDWIKTLAKRVKLCSVFLVFLSQNTLKSKNCQKEINFALSKERSVFAIHLEKINLPDDLDFEWNRMQALHKYNMDDKDFYEKLQKELHRFMEEKTHK